MIDLLVGVGLQKLDHQNMAYSTTGIALAAPPSNTYQLVRFGALLQQVALVVQRSYKVQKVAAR